MNNFFKNKKGFTLIEIVVSIGVFAVLSVALVGIIAVSTKISSDSNKMQEVSNQMQEYINDLPKDPNLIVEKAENQKIKIEVGGEIIEIEGSVVIVKDKNGKVISYKVFKPQ